MGIILSGCQAKIYANGEQIGFVADVRVSEAITNARVDVIGNIDSEEIEPVRRAVTLQCTKISLRNKALSAEGIWPNGGTREVVDQEYLEFELFNEVYGESIMRIGKCKPANRDLALNASDVGRESMTFDGVILSDVRGQAA